MTANDYLIANKWLRLLALACGVVLAAVSFNFSYEFGLAISPTMAIACGAISILSSFMISIWLGAWESLRELGVPKVIKAFTVCALALVAWDAFTNSMTSSFQRSNDIQLARHQEDARKGKGRTETEQAELLTTLKERGDKLAAEMTKLVSTRIGDYQVSVRPAAPEVLDGAIRAKQEEARQEERRGGCGSKCLDRKRELGHLQALRAQAKQIADNEAEQIRVTNSVANVRNEKAGTKVEASSALHQARKAAVWLTFAGDRKPSELAIAWSEDLIGSLAGIMVMLGAQAFTGIGTATKKQIRMAARRPEDDAPETMGRPEAQKPAPTQTRAAKRDTFREMYNRHCRTVGVAPVAT